MVKPAGGSSNTPTWRLGDNRSATQWQSKMKKRGWTDAHISEAVAVGQRFVAINNIRPSNGATRYIHPTTGRSVVLDDTTGEVIHIGGDGFVY